MIATALERQYVSASRGAEGAARLRAIINRGTVSLACGDGPTTAAMMTRAVRDAVNDPHLRIAFGPPDLKDPPDQPDEDALADNLGIEEVSRMPGGIGYLRISAWAPLSWVEPRLANAFALLQGSTAIILDVRGNRGGDGGTVSLVTRTFLPAKTPATLLNFDRAGRPALADKSKEPVWPRFSTATPLVVIIDRESASGSEALAFGLREEHRATIIGSRSAGASHPTRDAVSLPGGYTLYIPRYRLEGRLSHRDWEGVGVQPDIDAGLTDAKLLAWEFLRQRLSEPKQ